MNGEVMVQEAAKPKLDNFKEIKPETKMTSKEANQFWKKEFSNEAEVVKEKNTQRSFTDDNGVEYRDAERLLPNTKYELNGYQYETDDKGRMISAEGKLRIAPPSERNLEKVRDYHGQEYDKNDDRGHPIARWFGGSDDLGNLVPMDRTLNQGDYAKLEKTMAAAVKDGADVRLKVEPQYEGNSNRPSEFSVTYSINGEREVVVFKNESKAVA